MPAMIIDERLTQQAVLRFTMLERTRERELWRVAAGAAHAAALIEERSPRLQAPRLSPWPGA